MLIDMASLLFLPFFFTRFNLIFTLLKILTSIHCYKLLHPLMIPVHFLYQIKKNKCK